MHFWSDWLTVAAVGTLVVLAPGPNFAIVVRNSLVYSRRVAMWTALGLTAGNAVHITYCLIGIAVIVSQSILLFNAVKWLGAAYLVYLGIQSLRAKPEAGPQDSAPARQTLTRRQAFRSGLLTDLLNPKATLFFLSLFTQVIRPETPTWLQAIYGSTPPLIELGWSAVVVLVLTQQAVRQRFFGISHWLTRAMGGVFIALGVRLALVRASE